MKILIVGAWRSGTSFLRSILRQHPLIGAPSNEPHYIRELLNESRNGYVQVKEALDFVLNHHKFKREEFYLNNFSEITNPNKKIPLNSFFELLFESFKKPKEYHLLLKDPRSALQINKIDKVLKPDKVIFLVRDPRAVFASQKKALVE